jgi:D-alanyl-lipoteichoic acid acyltransferase DltB (MBOAT superfamily)
MTFNSFNFLCLFLPIVLIGFFSCRSSRNAKLWLLAASVGFYASLDWHHLPLFVLSMAVNYGISQALLRTAGQPKSRTLWLVAGLVFNLGLLGLCKYTGAASFPLGISFFTLQEIAFLVDVYQDLIPQVRILDFALFVAYFPRVVSGPILDYRETVRELEQPNLSRPDEKNLAAGLMLLFMGLGKKVLIADTLAVWANRGFTAAPSLTFVESWAVALCFTFQIYFDFSGYSDMAVGLARLFNIRLPNNFNSPYHATSIIDFWNRWHITLTRLITSYLYTPLIRSFKVLTFPKALSATFVTMVIVGIWHGPAWTFVVFGAIHGAAFVVNHISRRRHWAVPAAVGWLLTFMVVNVGFVFFRAVSLAQAKDMLSAMIGRHGAYVMPERYANWLPGTMKNLLTHVEPWHFGGMGFVVLWLPLLFALIFLRHNSRQEGEVFHPSYGRLAALVLLMFLGLLNLNQYAQFVYVNF